jgi:predicted anti-sigma-YlaC factor YlaD
MISALEQFSKAGVTMNRTSSPFLRGKTFFRTLAVFLAAFLLAGCSINRMAINAVSDALTSGGSSSVFTGDPDPELVGDALPFAIKMYEALLANNPGHKGLILTTGSLFIMYANAFVQGPAEFLPVVQFEEREAALERAKTLYVRGMDLILSGLDKKYPGFLSALSPENTLAPFFAKMKKDDVPSLYWAAAGGLSAFSLNPFDSALGRRVPGLMACIDRAYELDPGFNSGALDDLYVIALSALPEAMGGDKNRAKDHFALALEKSGGKLAGPYVSYAQSVAVPAQDYETFRTYLETALAIDPGAEPENRLINIISQRKARNLLNSASNYFILEEEDPAGLP